MTAQSARHDVTLIDVANIDDVLREEWRSLGADPFIANPYFSCWFLKPALKQLGVGVRLCLIRRAGDGLLIGLAPLVLGDTYAKIPLKHFSIWKYDHGYNGAPLIRRGYEGEVYQALIEWIDQRPEGAKFLRLIEHPFDDAMSKPLRDACAAAKRQFLVQSRRSRAVVSSSQNPDDMLSRAYSGKKRKELRRQLRRLSEIGDLQFVRLTEPEEVSLAIAQFIELELSGWKGRHDDAFPVGGDEHVQEFFTTSMRDGAAKGDVICDALMLDDHPIAMLFSLRSGDQLAAFKIAYNEEFAAYSPGAHLLEEATRKMLSDASIAQFDSCARSDHPLADRLWRERMTVAQINIPAAGALNITLLRVAAALEKLKRLFPKGAGAPAS